jgi:carbon-monoxide dehydrogenase small subunit
MSRIALTVNDKRVEAEVEPRTSLADFLRQALDLTGTHLGCEHGVCGACTIQLNGAPARSCIAFAVALEGAEVRTVEGFDDDPVMAKLREAFHLEHGLQCGFCTPGMLITARDIVTRFAEADEKRIRTELAGNLCRCTGYMGIVNAIQRVLREMPAEARLGKSVAAPSAKPASAPAAFRPFAAKTEAAAAASPATAAVAATAEKGWSRIADAFTVAQPRAEVWRLFADLPRMARCLPGANLAKVDGNDLEGEMRVAFGPIKASFAGTATLARDDAAMTGLITGGGRDARGGSRAKGQVGYRLVEEAGGSATRVEITLDYQLQGPLAQFSRSGLVKDFAGRLIAAFAQNLAASLGAGSEGGAAAAPPVAELKTGALIWSVLWARLKRLCGIS